MEISVVWVRPDGIEQLGVPNGPLGYSFLVLLPSDCVLDVKNGLLFIHCPHLMTLAVRWVSWKLSFPFAIPGLNLYQCGSWTLQTVSMDFITPGYPGSPSHVPWLTHLDVSHLTECIYTHTYIYNISKKRIGETMSTALKVEDFLLSFLCKNESNTHTNYFNNAFCTVLLVTHWYFKKNVYLFIWSIKIHRERRRSERKAKREHFH